MMKTKRPFGIYLENFSKFNSLFSELDKRNLNYDKINFENFSYDPSESISHFSLVLIQINPIAYLAGNQNGKFLIHNYLHHLKRLGIPVINGIPALQIETSNARQYTLLESLAMPYPTTRVISDAMQLENASLGIRFPIVIKSNINGADAVMIRFNNQADVIANKSLNLGISNNGQTILLQEYIPARGGVVHRVEIIKGKFLYAIKTFSNGKIESTNPDDEVINACEGIINTAGLEVGSIEFIFDERDGMLNYTGINAMSPYPANISTVIGFDPYVKLVDFLEEKAASTWFSNLAIKQKTFLSCMAEWDATN